MLYIHHTERDNVSEGQFKKVKGCVRNYQTTMQVHKATLEETAMVPPQLEERPHLCSQLEKTQIHMLCFLAECPIHQGPERAGGLGKWGFNQASCGLESAESQDRKSLMPEEQIQTRDSAA